MECPLYENERGLIWSRIKGFRHTTDLQALLKEKKAAIAIAQFIIDTRVLDQFREVDPEAVGTYESAEIAAQLEPANDKDTDVGTSSVLCGAPLWRTTRGWAADLLVPAGLGTHLDSGS
ncbi:hypothetical protein TSTA_010830 [Talaromyces stipitatus ATCC 10500]|uniref:Uncharacterized protein n=1 Tax=Talaromyces stipitatus (strain ATCC 10500 / CBS 375.48 / QM 6759 / NRRL 1006) TaxID=441959 RepID=B8MHI6_TALSN|nr:uncharacterized protein TSTA_010830 [Talaromyces stipitatus ATCC 10500]EED15967.1 hypothetical protein TSTA_010830 [Talaromyces stipitatus ATCC 10500]